MKRLCPNPFWQRFLYLPLALLLFTQCHHKTPEVQRKRKGPNLSFQDDLRAHLDAQKVKYTMDVLSDKGEGQQGDSVLVYDCEYVITWNPAWSQTRRDSFLKEMDRQYGIRATYGCMCAAGDQLLILTKDPIPINDRTARQQPPDPPVNDFDPNLIFSTEFFKLMKQAGMGSMPTLTNLIHQKADIDIAILDTGFDFENDPYTSLVGGLNVWTNAAEATGLAKEDDDSNCLEDDLHGWDFVNEDNLPADDHSHGTHVAGIIAQEIMSLNPDLQWRILPLKTHNERGNGSLFTISCALKYAIDAEVDIINASWGYAGEPSAVLQNDINKALSAGIVFVGAMGNMGIDINGNPYQTAQNFFPTPGMTDFFAIGADDNIDELWAESNYHTRDLNITALGIDVNSFAPQFVINKANSMGITTGFPLTKSGTSMAVPKVVGGMATTMQVRESLPPGVWHDWFINTCTVPYVPTVNPVSARLRGYRSSQVMSAVAAALAPPPTI